MSLRTAVYMRLSNEEQDPATPQSSQSMALTFVSLKAFGDFVIACHALRRVRTGSAAPPGLVAAEHLRPLASAIGFKVAQFIVGDASGDVPAAFDIRRRGGLAAVRSLVSLRRQLRALPEHGRLVFDRVGWRERWLVPGSCRAALPESANIYGAYARALENAGLGLEDAPANAKTPVRTAVIVPASRLAAKTIPPATIGALARVLAARGIDVETILLDGDVAEVPDDVAAATIPRQFPALIERLTNADVVISADSLPAHLAEFHAVPCFVVAPCPNRFWLPASCLRSAGWCLFDNVEPLETWIDMGDTFPGFPT